MNPNRTRIMVEAGVLIALATVLSLIKIYSAPQGGSVTAASMVPIMLFALRWGTRAGVLAGVAYGLLQLAIMPYIFHPAQIVLDYPLAFGLLGLAGLSRRFPPAGAVLAIGARFASHVVSGVIFFGSYAPEGTSPLLYSMLYNGSYLLPEVVISAIIVFLLWRVLRPHLVTT